MTTKDYQQQATDFLILTGTKLTASMHRWGKYFPDDKENRDIFRCRLQNSGHKYSFMFGQSIKDSTGSGDNIPTAYDILACLNKYPVDTFADFCSEYGYDQDSRAAYKTYKAVKREWENVNKLFTPDQIEILQDIN